MDAFKKGPVVRDNPNGFIYFGENETWFDWPDLFGIPVYNVSGNGYMQNLYNEPDECPLVPVWVGEETDDRRRMTREFYLRYTRSGDF